MKPVRRAPPLEHRPRSLEVELVRFEVASGYDGMFRGAPEPVIVVAGYAVFPDDTPVPAFRGVFGVRVPHERYPLVAPSAIVRVPPRARAVPRGADVVLVAAAVEDDGGDGASRVFGALERAGELTLASVERGDDARTLREIGTDPAAWRRPERARVIVDGMPLESRVTSDDWVGAAAVRFSKGRPRELRMHLASDDFLNDWTAVVTARFGV